MKAILKGIERVLLKWFGLWCKDCDSDLMYYDPVYLQCPKCKKLFDLGVW